MPADSPAVEEDVPDLCRGMVGGGGDKGSCGRGGKVVASVCSNSSKSLQPDKKDNLSAAT